jgi:hypothetical protein
MLNLYALIIATFAVRFTGICDLYRVSLPRKWIVSLLTIKYSRSRIRYRAGVG